MSDYETEYEKEAFQRGREEFLKNPVSNRDYENPYKYDTSAWEAYSERAAAWIMNGQREEEQHTAPEATKEEREHWAFENGRNSAAHEYLEAKNRVSEFKARLGQLMEEFGVVSLLTEECQFKDGYNPCINLPEEE
jgi:hypothetical protein